MYEWICMNMAHWNLSKSFQEGEWEKREFNGGDEPNYGTIHVYMEMSQWNPLYNYHILIKKFFKKEGNHPQEQHILLWKTHTVLTWFPFWPCFLVLLVHTGPHTVPPTCQVHHLSGLSTQISPAPQSPLFRDHLLFSPLSLLISCLNVSSSEETPYTNGAPYLASSSSP
jgi:hypothetical protein